MKNKKNILIDIGHPAHVHLFRNFIFEMKKAGYKIYVVTKEVNLIVSLLTIYSIPFNLIGRKRDSLFLKYIDQITFILKTAYYVMKYRIGIGMGVSMTLPLVSRITGIDTLGFDDDDTEATPTFAKYVNQSTNILTPDCLKFENRGEHHITYAGFHELAYLHPNRFTPDEKILAECGLKKDEVFFIMRFNSFKAHHDIGVNGLSIENKRKLIDILSKKGKIFITTERDIEPEFEQYKLKVSQEKAHSLIAFATMLIGDSQTMTSEAAVLGTPSVRCNTFVGRIAYLEEEEHKYHLTYGFHPSESDKMFEKIEELLAMPDLKSEWQVRRRKLLSDKIDVTAFLVWFVTNYPESVKTMKNNPDYQYNFK